jgi:hypothetical protein
VVPIDKIEHIDLIEGKIQLENQSLPIGRHYRDDFLERLHLLK